MRRATADSNDSNVTAIASRNRSTSGGERRNRADAVGRFFVDRQSCDAARACDENSRTAGCTYARTHLLTFIGRSRRNNAPSEPIIAGRSPSSPQTNETTMPSREFVITCRGRRNRATMRTMTDETLGELIVGTRARPTTLDVPDRLFPTGRE